MAIINGVKKGKQGTKGQKQIFHENESTLKFYKILSLSVMIINLVVKHIFFNNNIGIKYIFFTILSGLTYFLSIYFMEKMAKPSSSDGKVVGVDLNLESGVAEHIKDLIILSAACQIFSLISDYFLLLWLLIPIRGFYMLWVNFLQPWIFQPDMRGEISEKKQRKMAKKINRMH